MITVRSLSKAFDGTRAVSSLDFAVKKGEIFGIVGPDGAGKSTLLRMLSAILVPDEGAITLQDIDIYKDPYRIKEKIAYMPQRFGLYEDLTVEENIFFFGRVFGLRRKQIRERLPLLYRFSNLDPFKDRMAGKLSGGMKQKLGLACCLVHSPELILLDEPTNGVDPVSRREFWKILYELLSDGVTIVVSTAYLDEAERCGRVALMYQGRFIQVGEPGRIKTMIGKPLLEILCDMPREAEQTLRGVEEYRTIIRNGRALRMFVSPDRRHISTITRVLKKQGIAVNDIRKITPSLEDTFVEVILRGGAV